MRSWRRREAQEREKGKVFTCRNAPGTGGLAVLTACAILVQAPLASAEDGDGSVSYTPNRLLQMLGVGGGASGAAPAPSSAAAAPPSPPAAAPASPTSPDSGQAAPAPRPPNKYWWEVFGLRRVVVPKEKEAKVLSECPDIVVDGGAELRAPADADPSTLRYEIAINRMARECTLNGDSISIRVGLQGAAMLGPAGQPGAYYGNVRVALRRKSDSELFGAKTYRVGAAVPPGAARKDFSLLVDTLEAPFISAKAAEDYEVIVGFTGGAADAAAAPGKKRHSRSKS